MQWNMQQTCDFQRQAKKSFPKKTCLADRCDSTKNQNLNFKSCTYFWMFGKYFKKVFNLAC